MLGGRNRVRWFLSPMGRMLQSRYTGKWNRMQQRNDVAADWLQIISRSSRHYQHGCGKRIFVATSVQLVVSFAVACHGIGALQNR